MHSSFYTNPYTCRWENKKIKFCSERDKHRIDFNYPFWKFSIHPFLRSYLIINWKQSLPASSRMFAPFARSHSPHNIYFSNSEKAPQFLILSPIACEKKAHEICLANPTVSKWKIMCAHTQTLDIEKRRNGTRRNISLWNDNISAQVYSCPLFLSWSPRKQPAFALFKKIHSIISFSEFWRRLNEWRILNWWCEKLWGFRWIEVEGF